MESHPNDSETNLVIESNRKDRVKLFCKIYWRTLILVLTPFVLLPIAFVGENNAYTCFYVFMIIVVYWVTDALHPSIVSLFPMGLSILMGRSHTELANETYIRNGVLNCLGVMMLIVAIEHSHIHRRVALKLLLVFGCSHYRLSFLLFFCCMFLSLWVSNTMACGLMMPLVRAVLMELERMGILEMFNSDGKAKQSLCRHEQTNPRPTVYTVFYFLGIAYSATIGGVATLIGSHTNLIFQQHFEIMFPYAPKIDYPHFMLLSLPGVLLIEVLLYLWMNFYFLGMFRAHSEIALEVGMSNEEEQYIHTLLSTEYCQLGKIKFHEATVGAVVVMSVLLQSTAGLIRSYLKLASNTIVCVFLLFIIPVNLEFLKFFRRRTGMNEEPLPSTPTKACLNWILVRNNIHWSVLFLIEINSKGGSCTIFNALKTSGMTEEFEKFLLLFGHWPAPALALVVILFCKTLTEFGSNSCVIYTLMPNIASLSVVCNVNPQYLMLATTLAGSMPFHLTTGSSANAMVAAYVHISPWKMMRTGIGPSIITVVVIWFVVTLWSKAVWTDINLYPRWADFKNFNKSTSLYYYGCYCWSYFHEIMKKRLDRGPRQVATSLFDSQSIIAIASLVDFCDVDSLLG